MAVEWICVRGLLVRLEGGRETIDDVLRSVSAGDSAVDVAAAGDFAGLDVETHP